MTDTGFDPYHLKWGGVPNKNRKGYFTSPLIGNEQAKACMPKTANESENYRWWLNGARIQN